MPDGTETTGASRPVVPLSEIEANAERLYSAAKELRQPALYLTLLAFVASILIADQVVQDSLNAGVVIFCAGFAVVGVYVAGRSWFNAVRYRADADVLAARIAQGLENGSAS